MEGKVNYNITRMQTCIYHIQCPIYDPLSPPVQYYTITVNKGPQAGPYSVSVVATRDVGDSDTVLVENISK